MRNIADGSKKRKKTKKQPAAVDNCTEANEGGIEVDISQQRGAIVNGKQDQTTVLTAVSGEVLNPAYYRDDESRVKKWTKSYNELKAYLDNGGTWNNLRQLNMRLWTWVLAQRHTYKTGQLLTTRKQKLDEIGFTFPVYVDKKVDLTTISGEVLNPAYYQDDDGNIQKWTNSFNELKAYLDDGGTWRNLRQFNEVLWRWVSIQRSTYKSGKLLSIRKEKLDQIGFVYSGEVDFKERFDELKAFKRKFGHCNIPSDDKFKQLRKFLSYQRTRYRNGTITPEQISKLEKIGFAWETAPIIKWDTRYEALKKYEEEHGHTNAPRSHPFLGDWVHAQRNRYKKGILSATWEEKLNQIGFVWDMFKFKGGDKSNGGSHA